MAEKLNRDRSSRKQVRTISVSNNQSSSHRQFSSSRGENRDIMEPSLRRRDIQNSKPANNYPPLEDYAE